MRGPMLADEGWFMLVERPKDLIIAIMNNGMRYVGYPSENTMNTKEELTITGAVIVEEKSHITKPITAQEVDRP